MISGVTRVINLHLRSKCMRESRKINFKPDPQPGEILTVRNDALGGAVILIIVHFILDYGRPANPLGMPLVISICLFVWWVTLKDKIWVPQVYCLFLMLAVIAVMGPFAVNNFSVWLGFQNMVAWLACIAVPLMHFANSLRKIRVLVNTLIVLHCYLSGYAMLHSGFGPGGHVGDENDVALSLNVTIPLAFCAFLGARTMRGKASYLLACVVMIAGVVATNSRGGFLGLVAVFVYCFIFSPRKILGLTLGIVLGVGGLLFIPETYWEEMGTISRDAANEDVGTGAHRRHLWATATNMFLSHPLFGVGIDNFQWNAGDYMPDDLREKEGRSYTGTSAHSVYFTILAETGIAGVVVVCAVVYFSVKSILSTLCLANRIESEASTEELREDLLEIRARVYGFGGGMMGFAVSGVFLTAFEYPHLWYMAAFIVAIMKVTERLGTYDVVLPKEIVNRRSRIYQKAPSRHVRIVEHGWS